MSRVPRGPRSAAPAALLLALLLALLAPPMASAHVGDSGPIQTITQAVGPYELAITFELPPATPAPLFLSISSREDLGGALLTLRAAPRGLSLTNAPAVETATIPGTPAVYKAQVDVDRPGDWDLEVRADGPRGAGSAVIPFTVTPTPLPPYTVPLLVSLGGLFLTLLSGVLVAAVNQGQGRPAPRRATWALGQLAFAFGIAAAIFGAQQIGGSLASSQPATMETFGRPHVNVAVRTEPAAPLAGQAMTLVLELTDGGTGLPVDDLSPHHEALLHLVVVDEANASFEHLHPARLAAGRFSTELTPTRPGRHTAYVEIARHESGTQVIARDFVVGGEGAVAATGPAGLGARSVAGLDVDVSSSVEELRAGRQAVLTFSLSEAGEPVQDVQPWLGMAGHMIARSADGTVFSHVHAAEPAPPPGPLGQGTRYGPQIRFVYTFPEPGRYYVWGQFQRDGAIITVPLVLEVNGDE
jgi:hypothetical protein